MKFLLDVNASGALAHWLRNHGHNVLLVEDADPRMGDDKVLEWAVREKCIISVIPIRSAWSIRSHLRVPILILYVISQMTFLLKIGDKLDN